MKKGQGLPINTIIIAILAIAVLFIMLFLFIRKGGEFGKATTSCEGQGGGCIAGDSCASISSGISVSGTCPQGQICCRAVIPQEIGAACASNDDCSSKKCVSNVCQA